MRHLTCNLLVVAATLVTPLVTSCYVDPEVPVADGYEPDYYDGRVVYFDDGGRPFYYGDTGAVVWVPATSPYYNVYVNHWRVAGPVYHRWYASHGFRYHTWHGQRGYYGGHASVHVHRR